MSVGPSLRVLNFFFIFVALSFLLILLPVSSECCNSPRADPVAMREQGGILSRPPVKLARNEFFGVSSLRLGDAAEV